MSDKVMVDAGELARFQQIGRLAAHALDAYVSTLHVQECTIRNPGIALAKGDERRTVEQLAADLRAAAALAPAPAAASSGAEAGEALPADLAPMLTAVIEAGAAEWQCTEAMTAEQHGEEFARMVRETAERYGLGDEPRALHWLGVAGDRSLAFVGTSPHSPHLARALTGAWNQLVDNAPDLLASLAPAPAGAE